jgi:hypothetical protein
LRDELLQRLRSIEDAFGGVADDVYVFAAREQNVAFRLHGSIERDVLVAQHALRSGVRVAQQIHAHRGRSVADANAAVAKSLIQILRGEAVIVIFAGNQNPHAGGEREVGARLEFPRLRDQRRPAGFGRERDKSVHRQ